MKLSSRIFIFVLLAIPLNVFAQQAGFVKGYDMEAINISLTSDSGYILAGQEGSLFGPGTHAIMKTDKNGNILWSKRYKASDSDSEICRIVLETSDGGFILGGNAYSDIGYEDEAAVIKTDRYGNVMWSYRYGDGGDDGLISLCETNDGGFLLIGYVNSSPGAISQEFVSKIDGNGYQIWTRFCGLPQDMLQFRSVIKSRDGGYLITGRVLHNQAPFGPTNVSAYLLKLDSTGNFLWHHAYGTFSPNESAEAHGVVESSDGNLFLAGSISNLNLINSFSDDVFIVKTDSAGNQIWGKAYGGDEDDKGYSIHQTTDSAYIVTGYTLSFGPTIDALILKIDNNGDTLWTRIFPGNNIGGLTNGAALSNGYNIFAGSLRVLGNGSTSLIKISPDGNSPACSSGLPIHIIAMNGSYVPPVQILPNSLNVHTYFPAVSTLSIHSQTICFTSAMDDEFEELPYTIYPNPNDGNFRINTSASQQLELNIYNFLGELAYTKKITNNSGLDINCELNAGFYLLNIWDGNRLFTQKFSVVK